MNSIAIPKAPRRPFNLSARDFEAGSQIVGRESVIALYRVPKGAIFELDAFAPFRLQLKAAVSFNASADTVEITEDEAGFNFIRTPRPAPNTPTTRHPDVTAVVDGETVPVTEYDAEGGVLRLDTSNVTGEGTAYITHGEGDLQLVQQVPAGFDFSEKELYNDSFLALHETDQARGDTAPRMSDGPRVIPFGPQYQLRIVANTSVRLDWTPEAGHLVTLKGYTAPVTVLSREALNAVIAGRV